MATVLDITLFSHFSVVFSVLLIFVIVYALLEKTKFLGDNKGIHALIAVSLAILMLFAPGVIMVIHIIAPWFVLMIFFFFIMTFALMFMGVQETSIVAYMSKWDTVHWFILAFIIIITVGAIGSVYGQALLPYSEEGLEGKTSVVGPGTGEEGLTDTGDFNTNVGRVLFHPRVIGMAFLLLLASFTIRALATESIK